jgi:conjugative transposon TraM protein
MNTDRLKSYFLHKNIIWLILPICGLLCFMVYANIDKKDAEIVNQIPEVPNAKNDSAKLDIFKDKVNSVDSSASKNKVMPLDAKKADNYSFGKSKDSIKTNINDVAKDIGQLKSERNHRRSNAEIYQPDNSDRDRFAELEMLKKEAKQKLVADLLEKLLKTKEEEKQKELAKKPQKVKDNNAISGIEYENTNPGINTFHGLYSQYKQKLIDKQIGEEFTNFRAVIHANQEIISGGRLQIRLLEALTIKGKTIPKGTIIYGIANFGNERVHIKITSIFYQETIYPIELEAFDMDGMLGLFVPNILEANALKEASGSTFSALNVPVGANNSFGAALGNIAINSVSQTGKQYLANKVRAQKAVLKSNYFIYLK